MGKEWVSLQVPWCHRRAADLDDRGRNSGAVIRCGPDEHARFHVCHADVANWRCDLRGRGKADRAGRHAAGSSRADGDGAVDADRSVNELASVARTVSLAAHLRRLAATALPWA